MIWKKYTINTNTSDCELVCATLMDYGITDVQIDNNIQLTDEEMNQMYADFVKELPEDDGSCTVSFYLDEKGFVPEGIGTGDSPTAANETEDFLGTYVDIEAVKQGLQDASDYFGITPVEIEESSVDTQDWNNKWKEYFRPFSVGRVIIKPTWENVPEDMEGDVVISIDPGMAFGTGIHETTRLVMKGLQKYIRPGMKVLDLGCGSGILGIAAMKLGAGEVTAVDIDEQAVKVAEENFQQNGIDICACRLMTANILKDESVRAELARDKYDIVLANILADVIVPLSGFVHDFMKKDGVFISSGIIDYKEEEVTDAVGSNECLELREVCADGDWRSVLAVRR
ncbi:MAG: 50S ribosomal protein L11 methyltransferase [Parasporobacterium sp.]|nr:50S ribosomal protein L11 methyltransferase [Parasporobacterium sp.]